MQDAMRKRRTTIGERNGMSKLTVGQVRDIRDRRERNYIIAKLYGVSQGTVSAIKRGVRWGNVE